MTTTVELVASPASAATPLSPDELCARERAVTLEQAALEREASTAREQRLALELLPLTDEHVAKLAAIDQRRATIAAKLAANAELLEHLRATLLPAAERAARADEDARLAGEQAVAERRARALDSATFAHLATALEQFGRDRATYYAAVADARRAYDARRQLASGGRLGAEAAAIPEPRTSAAFLSSLSPGDVLAWGDLLARMEGASHGVASLRAALAEDNDPDEEDGIVEGRHDQTDAPRAKRRTAVRNL